MASADTSVFSFRVGNLPLDTFRVIEFTGKEAISECFLFTIRAVAVNKELTFNDGVGMPGALFVRSAEYETVHHGLITAFTQIPEISREADLKFTYEFILEPRLRLASFQVQNRIFQNKTVPQIVEEVLSGYLDRYQDFKIDVQAEAEGDCPKREFTVQYNESDLDFIQRLLEDEGIFYFFDHSGDREVLIITNKKAEVNPLQHTPFLDFRPESGLHADAGEYVDTLKKTLRWVTGRTVIKDYNYRTPETQVMGVYDIEGTIGEFYQYGAHVESSDEASRLARIRTEMLFCQREIYRGTGIARDMQSGRRFTLEKADAEGFNGDYLITRVTHRGDLQKDAGGEPGLADRTRPHYTNEFEAIPAAVQFRPALSTRKPKIPGILTAKVDGAPSRFAFLDEAGRYHAKLPFDLSGLEGGQASLPIRMNQPYGGPNYGIHFPIHNGNDILLAFEDGDPDRPVALGTVPNPANASPVDKRKPWENIIRTASGHQIKLDDKETGVHIASAGGHTLSMDDSRESKGIAIETSGSNSIKLDDKETVISITSKAGHSIKIDDEANIIAITTAGGHRFVLSDRDKVVYLYGGTTTYLNMDGASGNIALSASNDITLIAGGSLSLEVAGDFIVSAENTRIENRGSYSALSGADTNIRASTDLRLNAAQSMRLEAAHRLECRGMDVQSTGDHSNSLSGASVDIQATHGDCNVTGRTVNLNPT